MCLTKYGADVTVFSRHGTQAWLCLFAGDVEVHRLPLTKEGDLFQGFARGVQAGATYGFRVDGPWDPHNGHRFDSSKVLVDPFATHLDRPFAFHASLCERGADTASFVPKSLVQRALPDIPLSKTRRPRFIYELGVKSFTWLHPEIPASKRGTVAALAEPVVVDHLQKLGVDTVELMPLHAWIDERHLQPLGLQNAWGYNPLQYFALDPRLAPGGWTELRDAVAILHAHDIQVVLDVVFNHTGESDLSGPTLCLRGLDNAVYYAQTEGVLHNDSGCGNCLSLNTPPVTHMVLQAMRQLVLKTGIDGFRFDLATALGRSSAGFIGNSPLITSIQSDAVLSSRILIAEPWDVGPGGYQLGQFPGEWQEWNDKYRDDVRRFWRGDEWSANGMATRLGGSSDVFGNRRPSNSINFVAAHDGFTLRDVVTYRSKQNVANGENNRDGNSSEVTCMGVDVRALLATLFLSRGTVMLTAGDEFGRTQGGNNNAYAQDNETTWLDWHTRDLDLINFVASLSVLRNHLAHWFEDAFLSLSDAKWLDASGQPIDWSNAAQDFVCLTVHKENAKLAIILNGDNGEKTSGFLTKGKELWLKKFCSSKSGDIPAKSVTVFMTTSEKTEK